MHELQILVLVIVESLPIRFQKPKQWSYNERYRYPIPRGKEDPWETLLAPLLAKDKVQCDAWKDEVQNLLIFVCVHKFNSYISSKCWTLQGWTVLGGRNIICGRILEGSSTRPKYPSPIPYCNSDRERRQRHYCKYTSRDPVISITFVLPDQCTLVRQSGAQSYNRSSGHCIPPMDP